MTTTDAIRLQAESNNHYLDNDPKALSRQKWVEASILRFSLTVEAWPEHERVAAWRAFMLACDSALALPPSPLPVVSPTVVIPEDF